MRLSAVLATLTLVAMLFAGCSGDGDGEGSTTNSSSASRTFTGAFPSTSSSGSTTSAQANQPPTGSLTTSVPGGAAPLNVTFTVEGSDPDGDEPDWTLSFGDDSANENGTDLPAEVTHAY